MVLAAVVYDRKALLALAVLWHAAVDASAVYLAGTQGILITETVIFAFAVLGLAYILMEWRRISTRAGIPGVRAVFHPRAPPAPG